MSSNSNKSTLPKEAGEVDDAYLSATLLCFSRILPAVLNAAIDINLFDIIAKAESSCHASLSASQIASLLPNQHPQLANRLERILPLLASYSLLDCSIRTNQDGKTERVYSLSPVGKYFAFDNDGSSLAPLTTLINRGFHDLWTDVKDAIMVPNCDTHFENVYGMPSYKYMERNEELNTIFYKAMAHCSPLPLKRILKSYKGFEGVSTLVDVGGGVGETLKRIISAYPSIKGINFDLPHMIQNALSHPGIEHIEGDMFESVPNGDAILLKQVCHNWSDEDCVKFLKNCYKALPPHGKVIVLDIIIPEVPNSSNISKHTFVVDNLMLLAPGGKKRTENEFKNLCKSSGFSKFHFASSTISATPAVMEFYK
ncbi:isoliquiritigenin 2'-O-methyltransferase isoform X1 [Cajanus cajan]|uniref:isoliquiritigenin 2'-O-methyltransferase isoform X1 n=1 Tax=Cajanus cajan TaxID=3821 RepID=UPI00098D7FC1|nr:isoliquiritigenin 2'-O-methyltransferase isoform X1 [Cajanus cajan]